MRLSMPWCGRSTFEQRLHSSVQHPETSIQIERNAHPALDGAQRRRKEGARKGLFPALKEVREDLRCAACTDIGTGPG